MNMNTNDLHRAIDRKLKTLPVIKAATPDWDVVSWNTGLGGIRHSEEGYVIRCVPLYRCGFDGVGLSVRVKGNTMDDVAEGAVREVRTHLKLNKD